MGLPAIYIELSNAAEFVRRWNALYTCHEDKVVASYYRQTLMCGLYRQKGRINCLSGKNGNDKKIASNKPAVVYLAIKKLGLLNELTIAWNTQRFLQVFNPGVNTPICNIFLMHIIQPKLYPIFDQHVYRVYHYIKNKDKVELDNIGKLKEKNFQFYLNVEYCRFFKN